MKEANIRVSVTSLMSPLILQNLISLKDKGEPQEDPSGALRTKQPTTTAHM